MVNNYTTFSHFSSEDLAYVHGLNTNIRDFPPHLHDVYELVFIKKGDISYTIEGKEYRITKNCLVISRPSQIHSIAMNSQLPYERYKILFNEQKLISDIYSKIPHNVDVINFGGSSLVLNLFQKMDYYCENFSGDYLKLLLTNLVEEVFFNVFLTSKNFEQSSVYTVDPLINQAIEYIKEHITIPLNIDAVANALHISKNHLHTLFVKHLKISPKKYITSKKLSMAQRELRSGVKPTEVFVNCGFMDYSTFYRDYKKEFGHAPSDEANHITIREIEP